MASASTNVYYTSLLHYYLPYERLGFRRVVCSVVNPVAHSNGLDGVYSNPQLTFRRTAVPR